MNLESLLRPLRNRISNMVSRAVVQLVDDTTKMQLMQLSMLEDETRSEVERFQEYGFTSVPLPGAEAAVVFVGGRRDHGLIVAVGDRRYRLTGLVGGEVAMHDNTGSKIVMKANGDIQIVPSSGQVTVTGTLAASVDVIGGGKSLKTHTHPVTTAPGTTGTPT